MSTLRMLREARGLTLRDVARKSGVNASTLSRAERGKQMSIPNLIAVCDALGLNVIAKQMEWITS